MAAGCVGGRVMAVCIGGCVVARFVGGCVGYSCVRAL